MMAFDRGIWVRGGIMKKTVFSAIALMVVYFALMVVAWGSGEEKTRGGGRSEP